MSDIEFKPDTHLALVTGATGGIGKATCHTLARLGVSIAVHYHSARDDAEALAQELKQKYSVRAECFQADMGDFDAVRTLHADVVTKLGHPNILFLNAGTTCGISNVAALADVPIDTFEQTWRINTGSPILLTQLTLPHLLSSPSPWGRIILTSSTAAFTGGVVGPHYASSKSALHGFIHWLAAKTASSGITVNGIAPALVADTKMLPGKNDELATKVPVRRLGRPEEIAETVAWLLKVGYVTSKVVGVDGGLFVQ